MSGPASMLPATSPAWSEPTQDTSVGVDFLGTRQANLDMLRELTGVYNNQVRSARQHAIVVWAAWRFHETMRGRDDVTKAEFDAFLEAVETVQLVGQREIGAEVGAGVAGLGSNSAKNLGSGSDIPLRFKDYRRTSDTSAMAAVQYGPSAKVDGLGFLVTVSGIPVPTADRGRRLAVALDGELRRSIGYGALTAAATPRQLSVELAIDLARHGLVIPGPSGMPRPERAAYIDALFGFDGRMTRDRRSETLALILEHVRRLQDDEGVVPHDVRVELLGWDPARVGLPAHLVATARRWRVFQVRQLERYALEGLLGLAERWIDSGASDIHAMLQRMDRAVAGSEFAQPWNGALSAAPLPLDPLDWALSRGPWKLVWEEVERGLKEDDLDRAVRGCLGLLIGVIGLHDVVVSEPPDAQYADLGGRARVSLSTFREWWRRRLRWPMREVVGELLEEFVLQQHVAVAVSRYDNENRRLRFSISESGWELLPGTSPSAPGLTPDRLAAAMALLADVGLLAPIGARHGEVAYTTPPSTADVLEQFARRAT